MELDDLASLIGAAQRSVFRLETLAQYLVPAEAELIEAHRAGNPEPLPTPESNPYLARVQTAVRRGIQWHRVHVLDHPLTDYLRYELWVYASMQDVGEQIYIAERHSHPSLDALRQDFWLVDDSAAVTMIYDDEGRFVRPERADLQRCRDMRDTALRHAEPFQYYRSRQT